MRGVIYPDVDVEVPEFISQAANIDLEFDLVKHEQRMRVVEEKKEAIRRLAEQKRLEEAERLRKIREAEEEKRRVERAAAEEARRL